MIRFQIYILIFFCICLLSCEKTTTVSGIVTNNATGQPLEGVEVELIAAKYTGHGGATDLVDSDTKVTGTDGIYALEITGKQIDDVFVRFSKPGYLVKELILKSGDSKVVDKALNPLDAYLSYTIINESQSTSMYSGISGEYYNDVLHSGPGGSGVNIPSTYLLKVPGGNIIRIYWDTKTFSSIYSVAHTDSVFCARNDTTHFVLKF